MWQISAVDCFGVLLAQIEPAPRQRSLLFWMLQSLGISYSAAFLFVGAALFIGAVIVVLTARRPSVIAAYFAFVPLPLLLGLWATVDGLIRAFAVVASSTITPNPSEIAEYWSMSLFSMMVGILATLPGYLVTAIGFFVKVVVQPVPQAK